MPSPGEDIHSWSVTAANNGTADPLIDWHEGQERASVNNSSRSEMAAIAKNRNLLNGSIVTTGSANAQQFLSGVSYTSIPAGLRATLKVGSGLTNNASMTLNMDGIGNVLVKTANGDNLRGGEFVGDGYVDLLYNGTNWIFLYSREFLIDLINGGGGVVIGQQIFDTPGTFTYTPTAGMECCIIEAVGGGGGGGAAWPHSTQAQRGSGGGSGGYSRKICTAADIGISQTVTVGTGGAAGVAQVPANVAVAAGSGGASSLGTLCVANGGIGGTQSDATWSQLLGGAGGAAGTGDIAVAGSAGIGGQYTAIGSENDLVYIGQGGASYFGGGGQAGNQGNDTGKTGAAYGAGGGGGGTYGASNPSNGGPGAAGAVIITEFAGRGVPGRDGATGPLGPPGPSGSGTGDVLRSGTPTAGQFAQWTDASHIQGVALNPISNVVLQKFTASGTYTPTSGMKYCIVECIGGGGAGGGVTSGATAFVSGGGGGSGGYSRVRLTAAAVGASKIVTIGAGGLAGTAGNNPGNPGGDTSFGSLCIAKGGEGGLSAATVYQGGSGGSTTGAVGDVMGAGAPGHPGAGVDASVGSVLGGTGGSSVFGGGGTAIGTSGSFNGNPARNYGSGGGGGVGNNASGSVTGGAGSGGLVIVTEYI
jgi:hypothetical protein